MSLTYQPFANVPELKTLEADLRMNVSDGERGVSWGIGAALLGYGIARDSAWRWPALILGGMLLHRGMTGHCNVYQLLEKDGRHSTGGVADQKGIHLTETVEINRPRTMLYSFWRDLQHMPRILSHVQSVQELGGKRSHWKVKGPFNKVYEWDAEIISDTPAEVIAWQSVGHPEVDSAGSVRFEDSPLGATRITVQLKFNPPGGQIGEAVAEWLGQSPAGQLRADLLSFKAYAENELPEALAAV